MNCCTFTGHRVIKDLDFQLLDRVIENLIKNGCRRFLCGMAKGFDLSAAESVIAFMGNYSGIELVACIPCEGQSDAFSATDKARYARILENCTEVITLSKEYYSGCMHFRDRYMVENSDTVLCYLRRKSGGTYYTVNYAKKLDKKIIEL